MATYEDITIERIDFEWIKQCDKVSYLRKAVKVIEADGDYYTELKDACYHRMEQLDPRLKKKTFDNAISAEDKQRLCQDLEEWEQSLAANRPQPPLPTQNETIDAEKYFAKSQQLSKEQKQRLAQNQRNKGNESIKSKDFDQAISYYTKSVELDATMAASFCNRAFAYLKKKDFQKALVDCEQAIRLNSKYVKAFHRKGKAYQGLKNNELAYKSFKEALNLQPDNKQINGQLKQLRESMTAQQLQRIDHPTALLQPSEFKRIVIEEQDD